MNVTVSVEYRFDRTPDGSVWTGTAFAYPFWTRYLTVFDEVTIIARARSVNEVPEDYKRVDGPAVRFSSVPHYLGPLEYILKSFAIRRAILYSIPADGAVIFRVGSQIAGVATPHLIRKGRPYAVEVVGDPHDVFAPRAVKHPLRAFFRWWFTRQLKVQCWHAAGAAYVTDHVLQQRYPSQGYMVGVSDVELPESAFASKARVFASQSRFCLVTVGSLAQLYKGPDVLIDALAICVNEGLDLSLTLVGDGRYRGELESRSAAHGLEGRVRFVGQLTAGEAVRRELDAADLFVLPSRTEGLPRAMVEAMARALPCIGSSVGGIPELLLDEDLVEPGNARALADKIKEVLTNPERMSRTSQRNLPKARQYGNAELDRRRNEFYMAIRQETQAWLDARNDAPPGP